MATLRVYLNLTVSQLKGEPHARGIGDHPEEVLPFDLQMGGKKLVIYPTADGYFSFVDFAGEIEDVDETAGSLLNHPRVLSAGGEVSHVSLRETFYSRVPRRIGEVARKCGETGHDGDIVYIIVDEVEKDKYQVRIHAPHSFKCAWSAYRLVRCGMIPSASEISWDYGRTQEKDPTGHENDSLTTLAEVAMRRRTQQA